MKLKHLSFLIFLALIIPSVYSDVIWIEDWTWTDNDWTPYDGEYQTWEDVETDRVDGNNTLQHPDGPGGPMESIMIKAYPTVDSYCNVVRTITVSETTDNTFRLLFYVNQTNKTVIGGVQHNIDTNKGAHFGTDEGILYIYNEWFNPAEQVLNYSGTINPYTWYILYFNITYDAGDWHCDDTKLAIFGSPTIHQLNSTTDPLEIEVNRFFIGTGYGDWKSDTNATLWSDMQLQMNTTIYGLGEEEEYPELWGYDIPDIQPGSVISPTRIQLVEHEDDTGIWADIWFDRDGFAQPDIGLFIYSGTTSQGTGYAFVVFNRAWLSGKSYNLTVYYNLDNGNVTTGIYDGWYLRNSTTSFPDESGLVMKGNGKLKSIVSFEEIGNYSFFKLSGNIGTLSGTEKYATFFIFVKDLANDAQNNISIRRWMIYSGETLYWQLYPNTTLFCAFPEGHRNGDYENGYGYCYYYDQGGVGGIPDSGIGDSYFIDSTLFDEPPEDNGNGYVSGDIMDVMSEMLPLIMIMMVFAMLAGIFTKKKKKKKKSIKITREGNL